MIRYLYLLRHAKSSWDDSKLHDFDRPLNKRGREAAPRMASLIESMELDIDMALVSSAVRARETWALMRNEINPTTLQYMTALYMAPGEKLLEILKSQSDTVNSLILVGHNPGMEDLARFLTAPNSKKKAVKRMDEKFPTCAFAVFAISDTSWSELGEGDAQLMDFVIPRMLEADDN